MGSHLFLAHIARRDGGIGVLTRAYLARRAVTGGTMPFRRR
jgi:hypothetical protein